MISTPIFLNNFRRVISPNIEYLLMEEIITELREEKLYFDSESQMKKALKKQKKTKKVVVT